jgi:cytochrome c oxidase assembly protein subunit 15
MPELGAVRSRWLHAWAVLTVVATLPLLFLGAEVTTSKYGMTDPVWPTPPWYLLVADWLEHGLGFLVEHSHRLAGYVVGICAIVLAVGLWRCEQRRWLRWLGVAALLGVCLQGALGGMRVLFDRWFGANFALIHGCFAQLVFALLVTIALATSRRWSEEVEASPPEKIAGLRRWSLIVLGLVFAQLVLGAFFRHRGFSAAIRLHMLTAFAVVAAVVWLLKLAEERRPVDAQLRGVTRWLAALVALQVMLGVEAFFIKQAVPSATAHWLLRPDLVRSAHVLVGSFVLATAAVAAVEVQRRTARVPAQLVVGWTPETAVSAAQPATPV